MNPDRLANCRRLLLLLLLLVLFMSTTGCASYIGERIVRAPNLDRPSGIFTEEMDEAWESDMARHFLVEQTRITTPVDGVELHVAVLPTGNYPNRLSVKEDGNSISARFQLGLPMGPPRTLPKGTIIAIHGWQAEHRAMLAHAMEFAGDGWDVVLYDQRGHGRSEGRFVTFGAREAQDLQTIVEWTRSRRLYAPPLVFFGTSMGAATALLAATESRPKAIVAVAPYARLDNALPGALRHLSPFYIRPFLSETRIEKALVHAEVGSGVAIADVAPIERAAEVQAPVLLIHSESDQIVPFEHARSLSKALPNATLKRVEAQSHEALLVNRHAVLKVALPWLERVTGR